MWRTCRAYVFTPVNSLPLIKSFDGAKLYLSSGMASAAGTTSFSRFFRLRSKISGTVSFFGAAAGAAFLVLALGAGAAASCAKAPAHIINVRDRHRTSLFMGDLSFGVR